MGFRKIEKHLYLYEHEDLRGQWSRKYYAFFTDWQGIARRFPLSEKLDKSRDKLGEYHRLNDARHNFDSVAREREEEKKRQEEAQRRGMTLGEFAEHYFDVIAPSLDKRARTVDREQALWDRLLKAHFGSMPLCEIKLTATASYRVMREKLVSFVTVNRELAFVRYLLNLAVEAGLLDAAPRIKLKPERDRGRERTLSPEEYNAILSHMGREQQRYHIALYETGMRLREPTKVTWDKVDLKNGLIRLRAEDVKEKYPRRTPISWELRQVLEELRREQANIPNVGGHVFTRRNGRVIKSVRDAWLKAVATAVKKKQLPDDDFVQHDLRRSAITRWSALGIPRDVVMACSGHRPSNVHDSYIHFSDEDLVGAFASVGLLSPPSQRKKAARATAV